MSNSMGDRINVYESWSNNKSDEQLAEVVRKGESWEVEIAMRILIERYETPLMRYFVSKLHSYQDSEDALQETWLAFFRILRSPVTKGVSNLLWKIARNKQVDIVRKNISERSIENDTFEVGSAAEAIGAASEPPLD